MTTTRLQAWRASILLLFACGPGSVTTSPTTSPTTPTSPTVPASEIPPEKGDPKRETTHPATHEDCVLIVDQNVAAKLREWNITDPDVIEKRKKEIRDAMASDIDACVGRRVTDETLDCVRKAETSKAIDDCLRR
jgi:hypothetical protein